MLEYVFSIFSENILNQTEPNPYHLHSCFFFSYFMLLILINTNDSISPTQFSFLFHLYENSLNAVSLISFDLNHFHIFRATESFDCKCYCLIFFCSKFIHIFQELCDSVEILNSIFVIQKPKYFQ